MVDYVVPGMIDSSAGALSNRNRIINGAMGIWQRGTSFANVSTTNSFYTADRWGANRSNDASGLTVSQSTDVPSGFKYSAKFQRTAGDTAANTISIFNSNESINTLDFAGQQVTFSFYAKVGANWSASNNITASIRSGTGTDQKVYQFTGLVSQFSSIAVTNSWSRYSMTKTIPSDATEVGAIISTGVFTGTAGADDSLYITGVQLEKGSVATAFEYRNYQQELAMCQRYYEQTESIASFVGAPSVIGVNVSYTTGLRWHVKKRATPTVTIYNRAGTSGKLSAITSGSSAGTGTVSANNPDSMGCQTLLDSGNGLTAGVGYEANYTASAEL